MYLVYMDQERDSWLSFLRVVMNLSGFLKCGEFLDCLKSYKLLKMVSAPWS
jgi:hypothetical protein